MPQFVPGLDLNQRFFLEILAPFMKDKFPDLSYAAARLGGGSDVLGYDTEMSTDHDWGIRMQLFLSEERHLEWGTAVHEALQHHLPFHYQGFPVHFGPPDEFGARVSEKKESGPVEHRISLLSIKTFFKQHLNIDPYQELDVIDWLTMPQQLLLGLVKGRVFHDPHQELAKLRQKFGTYPTDVWLYLLVCQWGRIGEETHFVGRTGIVGDEIGSQLLASRLVHDLMQLCFLMEKQYAPYPKWFGTGFSHLNCAKMMQPILAKILAALNWQKRERYLCEGYSAVAQLHNQLNITEPLPTGCTPFFERPFQVISVEPFQNAIIAKIKDKILLNLDNQIGSIDQFSDSTMLRSYPHLQRRLRVLYGTKL